MRTWYRNLDYLTLLLWMGLVAIGLTAIYSTTHGPAAEFLPTSVQQNFYRQLTWVGICLTGFLIALWLPVRFYQAGAYAIYVVSILLLLAALIFGREINGAKSWLSIGPMQLQVSELAKVGAVVGVARLVSTRPKGTSEFMFGAMLVSMVMLPAVLIVLQNDAGTALVFVGLVPVLLYWSGMAYPIIALLVAPAFAGYMAVVDVRFAFGFVAVFSVIMWLTTRDRRMGVVAGVITGGTVGAVALALTSVLQPHQVARVLSFTNPAAEEYRYDVGFHLVQSLAAIGSGGLTGKGFMQGTQTQGRYVPEQSTDFIFSVIGEEFGLLGTLLVLTLFTLLFVRLVVLGSQMKHPFGLMVAAGAVGVYLMHVIVNVGMATALLPVIGIPLPFLSYGGSALLAHTALLAITLSLHMRRDDFSIYRTGFG